MDGETGWVGARIAWLIHSDDVDAEFAGLIETAEDLGDGIVRLSGPLTSGHRFVLVTVDEMVAAGSCSRSPVGDSGNCRGRYRPLGPRDKG
jgi:hypothetical protein